jgi:hypothetical protein
VIIAADDGLPGRVMQRLKTWVDPAHAGTHTPQQE